MAKELSEIAPRAPLAVMRNWQCSDVSAGRRHWNRPEFGRDAASWLQLLPSLVESSIFTLAVGDAPIHVMKCRLSAHHFSSPTGDVISIAGSAATTGVSVRPATKVRM